MDDEDHVRTIFRVDVALIRIQVSEGSHVRMKTRGVPRYLVVCVLLPICFFCLIELARIWEFLYYRAITGHPPDVITLGKWMILPILYASFFSACLYLRQAFFCYRIQVHKVSGTCLYSNGPWHKRSFALEEIEAIQVRFPAKRSWSYSALELVVRGKADPLPMPTAAWWKSKVFLPHHQRVQEHFAALILAGETFAKRIGKPFRVMGANGQLLAWESQNNPC